MLQDPDILGDFSQIFFLKTISRIILLGVFGRKKQPGVIFQFSIDKLIVIMKYSKIINLKVENLTEKYKGEISDNKKKQWVSVKHFAPL